MEKALADYQAQANKPFDHEARMKELLMRYPQSDSRQIQSILKMSPTEKHRSQLRHTSQR